MENISRFKLGYVLIIVSMSVYIIITIFVPIIVDPGNLSDSKATVLSWFFTNNKTKQSTQKKFHIYVKKYNTALIPYRPGDTFMTIRKAGRLGNNMFQYAALRGITAKHQRAPLLFNDFHFLEEIFNLSIPVLDSPRPQNLTVVEEVNTDPVGTVRRIFDDIPQGNVTLETYFQSFRYFQHVKDALRKEFTFRDTIVAQVDEIFEEITPQRVTVTRVGIHVRRGDLMLIKLRNQGWLFPELNYFSRSVEYFVKIHNRQQLHFIIGADDINWCQGTLIPHLSRSINVSHFTLLTGNQAAVDMAVLSSCDHVITTMGTFSYWAGWLCKGQTIYPRRFPPGKDKWTDRVYRPGYYYPPSDLYNHWIPL